MLLNYSDSLFPYKIFQLTKQAQVKRLVHLKPLRWIHAHSDTDTAINIHLEREKRFFKFKMKGFGHERKKNDKKFPPVFPSSTRPPQLWRQHCAQGFIFHVQRNSVPTICIYFLEYINTLLSLLLIVQQRREGVKE